MECNEEPYFHDPQYDEIWRTIITRGWQTFVNVTEETNTSLCLEFLAKWPERENDMVLVRRKKIKVDAEIINFMLGLPDYPDAEE